MKYVFTCGGTAGHIYPAVSVAQELKKKDPDADFLFIGAKGMMEMDIVPAEGYPIRAIPVTNLSRGKKPADILHNIRTVWNLILSLFRSLRIIRQVRPDAVIGTGGYVCFPVLFAAHLLGIPTFIHESNVVPGLTTKLLIRIVDAVFVGYEGSRKYYPADKVRFTGTPVRDSFSASVSGAEDLHADGLPLVLSVWGSLGSGYMNETMSRMAAIFPKNEFRLIHVAGKRYYEQYKDIGKDPDGDADLFEVRDYIYDIPRYLKSADLILCRAGASTLSELAYLGKPAVIVPSPNVTNNHQEKNARLFEEKGAAVVLTEGSFDAASLLETIRNILTSEEIKNKMAVAMRSFAIPDAARIIAENILSVLDGTERSNGNEN